MLKSSTNIDQFPGKSYPILDLKYLISMAYPGLNCLKTIPFTVAHTYTAHNMALPQALGIHSTPQIKQRMYPL